MPIIRKFPEKRYETKEDYGMKRILLFLALFAALLTASVFAESFTGKVVGVTDGNNINVTCPPNIYYTVKLEGVDCPDLGQSFGPQARQFLESLILSKSVWVDVKSVDHNNRRISQMVLDGNDVAVTLAEAGLCWFDSRFSHNCAVANAVADATAKKLAIWSQPNPLSPWDFRMKTSGVVAATRPGQMMVGETNTAGYNPYVRSQFSDYNWRTDVSARTQVTGGYGGGYVSPYANNNGYITVAPPPFSTPPGFSGPSTDDEIPGTSF
jgi:endonuclease YncB( thermonuclease family)